MKTEEKEISEEVQETAGMILLFLLSQSSQLYGLYFSSQTAWLAPPGLGCLHVSTVSTFLHVRCLLGTGRNPCTGKTEERKIHDRGNEIIYFVGDSFEFCSSFSVLKKCNGIWDASYLGEEANLKNTQSNSFSAEKFVLSMYMCKYVTFVLWMLMKAS